MSNSYEVNMSEVENIVADIDNNLQKTPKATPSKRLTRAERARIESELLVKALGGSLEGGRRTRAGARGSAEPSPIAQELVKRKSIATPRRTKKVKANILDEIDGGDVIQENHLPQNASDNNTQDVEVQTKKPVEPEVENEKVKEATETITEPTETQIDQNKDAAPVEEVEESQKNVPSIQQQLIDETITIDGDSLNASPEASNAPTPMLENEVMPSVADTTTTTTVIVEEIDSNASESQELNNCLNDDVTIVITSPSENVSPTSESSQKEPANTVTPPIEIIDVKNGDRANAKENEAMTKNRTQIVDLSGTENEIEALVGNNNSEHSNNIEMIQDVVGSTNNGIPSECARVDKKTDVTVAVNSPMEETITTTSDTTVETPATAV